MIDNKILGKSILHASLITALSVLCSIGIRVDLDSIFNYSYNIDSDVTDFYTRVAESRSVKTLVEDIRFVDIGAASRGQIAETLMEIENFNPAIIGLDVQFIEQHFDADDSFLEEVIISNDNIIIATDATADSPQSFFYDKIPTSRRGFINLGDEMEVIRKYQVKRVFDGDILLSFPAQIVKGYNPEAFSKLMKRGNGAEYIKYPSKMFYEPYAYFQVPQIGKELTGKVVLVGDILGNSDEHFTPIHPRMKGLMIHAYSVASILDGKFIKVSNGV
ncbi:MAG: CHASE2 domain-containing protein, partial [Bacteroidales bacterium]|nr:CHASE2 domain-containing protein [Bacteroidales bacterium]